MSKKYYVRSQFVGNHDIYTLHATPREAVRHGQSTVVDFLVEVMDDSTLMGSVLEAFLRDGTVAIRDRTYSVYEYHPAGPQAERMIPPAEFVMVAEVEPHRTELHAEGMAPVKLKPFDPITGLRGERKVHWRHVEGMPSVPVHKAQWRRTPEPLVEDKVHAPPPGMAFAPQMRPKDWLRQLTAGLEHKKAFRIVGGKIVLT
jgi:hypothetical protein